MTNAPPITRESSEWTQCKSWLVHRIHHLQRELERLGLGEREGDAIRGRISELRGFILAVEPQKRVDTETEPLDASIDY
jgi:hypothetical protein